MSLMYQQNSLFRSMATASFLDLVQTMALQPAMLLWLDNGGNTKGNPNENLHGSSWSSSRSASTSTRRTTSWPRRGLWTGHNTLDSDRTQYYFYASRHDTGQKTFMGVTQNWDGPDIMNFFLQGDPTHQMIAGRFIATEMWSFLAYPDPDDTIVTALANTFISDNLSIAELVRVIFDHPAFISPAASRGACARRSSGWSSA